MKSKGLKALDSIIETFYDKNTEDIKVVRKELVEHAQYKQAINVFKSIGFTLSETIGGEYFIIIGEKTFKLTKKSHDLLKKVYGQ